MKKSDNLILNGVIIGFTIGFVLGIFLVIMFAGFDIGHILENNGLTATINCKNYCNNVSYDYVNYRNLTLWCIDRLQECNDINFQLIHAGK